MFAKSLLRATRNADSTKRIFKIPGQNINVASHNQERRSDYSGDFGFIQTFYLGTEGFSKANELPEMNPIKGNKKEFIWLFAFLGLVSILPMGRKMNEDGLRSDIKTTNRYAKMDLDTKSRTL